MNLLRQLPSLACALAMIAVLAGCHATVEAKWATGDDTVYRWEKAAPTLPVEVRGQLPNASQAQMVQAIPNAVATAGAGERWVVEVSQQAAPHDDAYCQPAAHNGAPSSTQAALALTVTLCDGHRLVATSRSPLDAQKSSVDELPRRIKRLKNLALIGIARSPAQYIEVQS